MTNQKTEKLDKAKSENQNEEQLIKKNKELELTVQILSDLQNLKDEAYYRRQQLVLMERIALALENFSKEEEESEEESEEEESEED